MGADRALGMLIEASWTPFPVEGRKSQAPTASCLAGIDVAATASEPKLAYLVLQRNHEMAERRRVLSMFIGVLGGVEGRCLRCCARLRKVSCEGPGIRVRPERGWWPPLLLDAMVQERALALQFSATLAATAGRVRRPIAASAVGGE